MDSLTIAFLITIGLVLILTATSSFLLAKMRSLKKKQSIEDKNKEARISDLQGQASSLQNELTRATANLVNTQREISDVKDREPRTITEQRQLKKSFEATAKERDRLAKEKLTNQEAISRQEQKLEQANAQLLELRETLRQKEHQLRKFQDTNQDTTAKMQELESDIAQLHQQKQTNQEAISRQEQKLEQANAQLSELQDAVQEKEQSFQQLQGSNTDTIEKVQALELQMQGLSQEKLTNQETISRQEQKLEQANAQLLELRETLRQKEHQLRKFQNTNQEKEQSFQQLQGSNTDTIEKVQALELQMQGLSQEKLTNQETISRQEQELEQANAQFSELRETLRQKEQQLRKFQDTNQDTTAKMQELESDIAQLHQQKQTNQEAISRQEQKLEQANAQLLELQDAVQEKEQHIQKLEAGDYAMSAKLKQAQTQIEGLEKETQTQQVIITEVKKETEARENQETQAETAADEDKEELAQPLENNEEEFRRLLLEKKLITRAILRKALKFQKKHQDSLLRFLFVNREIDESLLAVRLSLELPYLPLGNYEILYEVIKLLPSELVEKHWMLPIDRMGNSLLVVMVDPFDNAAIKKIEELTGCTVQKYVGLFSEIAEKIQHFYKVNIRGLDAEGNLVSPLFIETVAYKGRERRRALRLKADLTMRVVDDHQVVPAKLDNVSWDGLSFELGHELPSYSMVTIQLNMPQSEDEVESQPPVLVVAQVVRATALANNNFMIGVQLLKIPKEDLDAIIGYASASSSSGPSE